MKLFKQTQQMMAVVLLAGFTSLAYAQTGNYSQDIQMGNSAYAAKVYPQAAGYYQAAINENPNGYLAYQGLANCLYFLGNYTEALKNYQTALNLNPTNVQLAQFVQLLQAKLASTANALPVNPQNNVSATSVSSSNAGHAIELDLDGGLAVGTSLGFGGGAGVYFPLDKNLSLGGSAAFYTFSSGASETENTGYGTTTAGGSSNTNVVELMFSGKYTFDGNNLRPYLWGGVGAAYTSGSASAGSSASAGGTSVNETLTTSSSAVDPMLAVGGGLELPMGNHMNLFAQTRLALLISLGGSSTNVSGSSSYGGAISGNVSNGGGSANVYVPVEVGINFDL